MMKKMDLKLPLRAAKTKKASHLWLSGFHVHRWWNCHFGVFLWDGNWALSTKSTNVYIQ
jgi:hypothetical protein